MVLRTLGWRGLVVGAAMVFLAKSHFSSPGSLTVRAQPERPPVVRDLYNRSCARCHGKDGKGEEARDATPSIPDFTSRKWQEERSDAQLLTSIQDGRGKEMPAFADKFGRERSKELVSYIRQFSGEKTREPPHAAADSVRGSAIAHESGEPAPDWEKRFHELTNEWEALRKQFRELQYPPNKP